MLNLHKNVKRFIVFLLLGVFLLTGFTVPVSAASFRPQINIINSSADIPEPDPENTGEIYWVNGRVQEPGEGEDAIVQIDYDLNLFSRLTVNGVELTLNKEYYLEEGSTIITLTSAYMAKLEPGNYTLIAYYSDGKEFSTAFVISEHPETVDPNALTPDTGMMTFQAFGSVAGKNVPFITTALMIVIVAILLFKKIRKRQNNYIRIRSARRSFIKRHFSGLKFKRSYGFGRSYNPVLKKHIFIPVMASAVVLVGGAYVFSNVFMPVSEQNDVQAANGESGTLSISATGESFVKDLDLSSGSAFVSTSQVLTVNDTTSNGYKLYISTDSSQYNDLTINGSTSSEAGITATSGTFEEPDVLDQDAYGFAVANEKFGNNYTPSSTSKWAGIPVLGSETLIKDVSVATSAGDTTTIYYGFNVTNNLPDGSYYGTNNSTIVYKAIANVLPGYEIRYSCNGGSGDIALQTKNHGESVTLSDGSGCSKQDYHMTGWNTMSNGSGESFELGGSYSRNEHLNLYAMWELDVEPGGDTSEVYTYKVVYNTKGGSGGPASESKTTTESVASFTISSIKPSRTNYTFAGWCDVATSGEWGEICTGNTYVSGNNLDVRTELTTLYAIWRYDKVARIKVTGSNSININQANHSVKLSATVEPASAKEKGISWSSSNTKVATVNESGVVTGVDAGVTTITAKPKDSSGKPTNYNVVVKKKVLIIIGASQIARISGSNFANTRQYKADSGNIYTSTKTNQYGLGLSAPDPKHINDSLNFIYYSGRGFQFSTGQSWGLEKMSNENTPPYSGWSFAKKIIGNYSTRKDYVDFYVYFNPVGNDLRFYTCDEVKADAAKRVEIEDGGKVVRTIKVPRISEQVGVYNDLIEKLKNSGYNVNGYVTSLYPVGWASGEKNKWVSNTSCAAGYRSNFKYSLINYYLNKYIGNTSNVKFVNMFNKIVHLNGNNVVDGLNSGWKDYKTTDGVHWDNNTASKYFKTWMGMNNQL